MRRKEALRYFLNAYKRSGLVPQQSALIFSRGIVDANGNDLVDAACGLGAYGLDAQDVKRGSILTDICHDDSIMCAIRKRFSQDFVTGFIRGFDQGHNGYCRPNTSTDVYREAANGYRVGRATFKLTQKHRINKTFESLEKEEKVVESSSTTKAVTWAKPKKKEKIKI